MASPSSGGSRLSFDVRLAFTQAVNGAEGFELVRLANGALSVRARHVGETFHPVIGPVAEAEALYVRQLRLVERAREHPEGLVLWDVGLGAAANVLTVLRALRQQPHPVTILSFDHTLAPLRFAWKHAPALGYFEDYEEAVTTLLARGGAEFRNGSQPVNWRHLPGDFPSLLADDASRAWPAPHAVLFDAYSPARNPAMWTLPLFRNLHRRLDPARPCTLPTYSRSTLLRVTLLVAGFHVGRGHATGEKEETTIAANTPDLIAEPLGRRWLERALRSTSAEPLCEPVYRQAPLAPQTRWLLLQHPQFAGSSATFTKGGAG